MRTFKVLMWSGPDKLTEELSIFGIINDNNLFRFPKFVDIYLSALIFGFAAHT